MRDTGFTVTEMMIVLVLSGLALAITSPSISRAFRWTTTRVAVDEFVSMHALTRSVAVRYGRVAELHIDASSARFWVEVDTSSAGGVKDTVGVVRDLSGSKLTMTSDRSILCFDARGLPTTRNACEAADATLSFALSGKVDTVQITALGKILR